MMTNKDRGVCTRYLVYLWGMALLSLFGCSAESDAVGSVNLALSSSADGVGYELQGAAFEITGTSDVSLGVEDTTESEVALDLPAGDYQIELQAGWALVRTVDGVSEPVEAVLLTSNPNTFSVIADSTTQLNFVFEVSGEEIELGNGMLQLGIEVQVSGAPRVLITEIMRNPTAVSDSAGEWIELANMGATPVSLQDCLLTRDDSSVTIADPLVVEPGDFVVLANGAEPGFVPDYVYSSLTLPNSAAFTLGLSCAGELLDAVTVDPAVVSNASGRSWSLDGAINDPENNDAPESWCDAVDQYSADYGTPGSANPSCTL